MIDVVEKPSLDLEQPDKNVVSDGREKNLCGLTLVRCQTHNDTSFNLQKLKYPKSVFFIIVNEFCERFNYYGMKSKKSALFIHILTYIL